MLRHSKVVTWDGHIEHVSCSDVMGGNVNPNGTPQPNSDLGSQRGILVSDIMDHAVLHSWHPELHIFSCEAVHCRSPGPAF